MMPDFKPLFEFYWNQRTIYFGLININGSFYFCVEYFISLDTGEDKWIKKSFNTWNECKNFLLAEGFINLNQFSSTSERFHYLQKIDEIMLYAM